MRLFRAAPFAFVGVGNVVESALSDISRHPHPRLPVGMLKIRKNKKSAFGGKKSPAVAGTKTAAFVYVLSRLPHVAPTCLEDCIGRPLPIFFFPLARIVSVCFFTGVAGLFLRPSAAFCPVVSSAVMPRMTVVVAVVTRRKTCFPTVGGAIATKAKPSEDSTAFCIYLILMATISNLISLAAIENK